MGAGVIVRHGLLASMRVRIVATVVVLLLASSIISVFLLRQVLFGRLDDEIEGSLVREVEEFRLLSAGVDPGTGEPFGDDFAAVFDVYFAREVPDEGESLLAFVGGELYRSARAQDAADAGGLAEAISYWLTLDAVEQGKMESDSGEVRYVALPLRSGDSDALFVVANFPSFERDEIDEAVQAQSVIQLATFLLASLLGLALAGRVLGPLQALASTARTITDTDLTRRIPVRGRDEASQIAAAFNDMVDRLEQAFVMQRQFVDDAGHELRTPLTVIRGHVELLEVDTDPVERRQSAALIADEIDRMNRIVGDLLLLARSEQPDFLQVRPLRVQELMIAIHRKVVALASRDWRLDVPHDALIHADGQRLTQAMMQFAENAAAHTGPGDLIRLGATVEPGSIRLWVHDTGPGLQGIHANRVFDRFARGSRRPSGGAGLGLSIVAAIAEAHHGTARVATKAKTGARFEIVLPLGPHRPEQAEP